MRLQEVTDRVQHPPIHTPDDHHPQPASVGFASSGVQSLPPGTDYTLVVALPHAGFRHARVVMTGPRVNASGGLWRECADVQATTVAAEAIGTSNLHAGFKTTYNAVYSKLVGDAYLTHKIFDTLTGASQLYIALKDAQIVGAELRLTFHNFFGGSSFLWVKGQAILF